MPGRKSTHRLYLDHNATGPLAPEVIDRLRDGALSFANPASIHASGKEARRALHEAVAHIKRHFEGVSAHQLIFHSGATEGVSLVIKGHALELTHQGKKGHYFLGASDHSCVLSQEKFLKTLGHEVSTYPVDSLGVIQIDKLKEELKKTKGPTFINWTAVNNETGVAQDLAQAAGFKRETGAFIHVDAAQLPFKLRDWNQLLPEIDAYTFSGHKFGALKGVGMSFIKEEATLFPLLDGGGQQSGRRSGTENVLGTLSLAWALESGIRRFDPGASLMARAELELELRRHFGERILVVGAHAPLRACNTLGLAFPDIKADRTFTAFDLAGIDIGVGPACSSGSFKPSRVMMAMGMSEDLARTGVRLSFSPFESSDELRSQGARVLEVLKTMLA